MQIHFHSLLWSYLPRVPMFLAMTDCVCVYIYIYIYIYIYVHWTKLWRKPVNIWCDHHLPHAVQHISFAYIWSGCWLWPVEYWSTPLQWLCEVCWILAGTGKRCRIRRSRASQTCSMGGMSSEYAGHARTGMFSASRNCVQILAKWGRALSWCNMRWWSWMNGTTMGLRISSRYLCSFKMPSIKCTCVRYPQHTPAHTITPPPPWATRSTHAIHAVCHLPCTVKTGIHPWREHLSEVPDAIECEHLPTQVGFDDEPQSGRDPDEDDEHRDELPWDCFWPFVQKLFGYANRLLPQLSGWLVSDDLRGEDAGCEGSGLVWLHVVCGCEAGWM